MTRLHRSNCGTIRKVRQGFSLVEVLIVAVCLVLLIGPILSVLRSGARTSRKGMMQIDTVLEARRILQQVHQDLKHACVDTTPTQDRPLTLADFLTERGAAPQFEYSLLAFPFQGDIEKMVQKTSPDSTAPRLANRISYRVEKSPATQDKAAFLTLIREEEFHPGHPVAATLPGGKRARVLTRRLNYFRVQVHDIPTHEDPAHPDATRGYFWVTLQLRDLLPDTDPTESQNADSILARSKGIVIADFYDVVYPEFLNALNRQPRGVRNWHTVIQGPAAPAAPD